MRYVLSSMKKHGIALHTGARLLRVEKAGELLLAAYEENGQQRQAEARQVLMAVGRSAELTGIDAERLGLALDEKGFIRTDDSMRTNLAGVYAIGDVAGGMQLASIAYAQAHTALSSILGHVMAEDAAPVPTCIHTLPCYASVGLSSTAAREQNVDAVVGSFSYGANGMALAQGAAGSIYAVMDRQSKRTLGVTIVGEGAAEMIAFAARTVAEGLSLEQWERAVITHPSLSEMLREAALDAFGKSVHKA